MSSLSGASPSRVSASGSPPPGAVGRALLPNVMEAKSALPDSWLQTSPQGGGRFGEITNQRACERWRVSKEVAILRRSEGLGGEEELRRDYASCLCHGDFGLGPILSTLCIITHLTLTKTFATHTIIIPIASSLSLSAWMLESDSLGSIPG